MLAVAVLSVSPAQAVPTNDACEAATVVASTEYEETLDTVAATFHGTDPVQSCSVGGPAPNSASVWYSFTPPTRGWMSVSTLGSDYDTVLAYYTGACGALVEFRCDDNFWSPTLTSAYTTLVEGGTGYSIEVTSHGLGPGGTLEFDFWYRPHSTVCTVPQDIEKGKLRVKKLGLPLGDEILKFSGRILASSQPLDVVGAQFTLEDGENGFAAIYDVSHRTIAIPPGAPGTGCSPDDGWTTTASGRHKYVNKSGSFPPACVPGSAQGLAVALFKPRAGAYRVKLKATDASISAPLDDGRDLRAVIALGADAAASNTGPCGAADGPTFDCNLSANGASLRCRVR
jgi:hypothetical protein